MAKRPDISIIGPGKVGTAIGVLAARAGWPVRAVAGRDPGRARRAARMIARAIARGARSGVIVRTTSTARPARSPSSPPARRLARSALLALPPAEAARAGGLVLLTVPDDAIESVCRKLAAAGAFRPGCVVAHCSGALPSDALQSARAAGCHVGSMHPLQTFPTVAAAVGSMPGAYCFIEGDAPAVAALARLARAIGGRPVRIAPGAKTLYHAAACVASNYLVALMDFAAEIGQAAGIGAPELLRALSPLVRATVDNVFRLGPARALTGPIARGDARTVRRHLEAIRRASPPMASLYAALAQRTRQLARRKKPVTLSAARGRKKRFRQHEE